MTSRLGLLPATALVIVLAACSPQPAPTPSASPTSASTPSSTPTSTPVPIVLGLPPRVPVTCDDLVPEALRGDILGAEDVIVAPWPFSSGTAAGQQGGMLSCRWVVESTTTNGSGQDLRVDVLADAAGAFQSSTSYCYQGEGSEPGSCRGADLTGEYWWTFTFSRPADDGVDINTMGSALTDRIATVLASAGQSGPPWSPPTGALTTTLPCAALDPVGSLRGIVASPGIGEPVRTDWSDVATGSGEASFVGVARGGLILCMWSTASDDPNQATQVIIEIVPGSAWSWDLRSPRDDAPSEEVVVTAADAAKVACANSTCDALILIRDTVVAVRISYHPDNSLPMREQLLELVDYVAGALVSA